MGTLEVLETVVSQVLRAQAQGLLVGLRDGSGTVVTGVLHCTEDELPSTKGEQPLEAAPGAVRLPVRLEHAFSIC